MKKTIGAVIACVVVALALAFFYPKESIGASLVGDKKNDLQQVSIIPQEILGTNATAEDVLSIYYKDQLLGNVHDIDEYNAFLSRIYDEKYAEKFPNSKVGLGEDIHASTTLSYYEYEDKDEEIFAYLEENNLFSIMGSRIEFSSGAIAYVKDTEVFLEARRNFLLNFLENEGVDPEVTLKQLESGQVPTTFSNDGLLDVSYKFDDTAKVSDELVPIDLILTTYDECMTWLSFGYDYEPEYYTVKESDMIEGVAWLHRLTPQNLVSVNADQLKSVSQALQVGMELNVTSIDSPINVEVIKQRMSIEPDYPETTKYVYDDTMNEGVSEEIQAYKEGSYRVLYKETYENGVLNIDESEEVSRLQIEYPQQQIIRLGTRIIPSIGSGSFRYPVNNATVTCDWMCYGGHTAIDVQNRYNNYDYVYAADRGVVMENGYNGVGGWYVVINHNNGLYTYYGHMNRRAWVEVGQIVDKGQDIGQIGMTGVATGPHVHFEVRGGSGGYGSAIYPWPYIGG